MGLPRRVEAEMLAGEPVARLLASDGGKNLVNRAAQLAAALLPERVRSAGTGNLDEAVESFPLLHIARH